MNKIKQFGKEISVFCVVIIIVALLFCYKQINLNDYKYIDQNKLVTMYQDQKDFIVVLGKETATTSSSSSTEEKNNDPANITSDLSTFVKAYIKKNHQKVYYVKTDDIEDYAAYLEENFKITNTSLPMILFVKNGEVKIQKSGSIKYVEFSKLVDEWKNN